MSHLDIIRAWKDLVYRQSLSEAQQAQLPPLPIGRLELPSAALADSLSGRSPTIFPCGPSQIVTVCNC